MSEIITPKDLRNRVCPYEKDWDWRRFRKNVQWVSFQTVIHHRGQVLIVIDERISM